CHRSPRSNPIVVLSRLLLCCSLIRLRVYQTLSRQVLSAFSSNLVRTRSIHRAVLRYHDRSVRVRSPASLNVLQNLLETTLTVQEHRLRSPRAEQSTQPCRCRIYVAVTRVTTVVNQPIPFFDKRVQGVD